jgi:anti-sigma regulatory factor (Ser/Thr protein kinase)
MLVRLSLDLPDDAASVPLCRHVTRVILEQLKISPERRQEIELALGEAASNVVRHAYPRPGNQYHVEVELVRETLRLTVMDHGQGFAREAVPDPDEAQLGGRGVQLIEQIADVAWFECVKGQGTRLVAEFAIPSAHAPTGTQPEGAAPPPESGRPPPQPHWPA